MFEQKPWITANTDGKTDTLEKGVHSAPQMGGCGCWFSFQQSRSSHDQLVLLGNQFLGDPIINIVECFSKELKQVEDLGPYNKNLLSLKSYLFSHHDNFS